MTGNICAAKLSVNHHPVGTILIAFVVIPNAQTFKPAESIDCFWILIVPNVLLFWARLWPRREALDDALEKFYFYPVLRTDHSRADGEESSHVYHNQSGRLDPSVSAPSESSASYRDRGNAITPCAVFVVAPLSLSQHHRPPVGVGAAGFYPCGTWWLPSPSARGRNSAPGLLESHYVLAR